MGHHFIREILIPMKGIGHYRHYFRSLYLIVVRQDGHAIGTINICIIFCVLKCVHFLFLYLYQLSNTSRIILFDIFYSFGMSNDNNFIMASLCLLTGLFYWVVYFANYNRLTAILFQVLIERNVGFFLDGHYRHKSVSRAVRHVALLAINIFQPLVLITELFALFCQLFTMYNIYLYWDVFSASLTGMLDLCLMELNALFMGIFMIMFTHICVLLTSLGIVMTYIFFIKMDQIYLALLACPSARLTGSFLWAIARLSRKNFLIFDHMNDVYGKMFCLNLLLNCPINAYLVISMIRIPMSAISLFFIGSFAFQQMASIFGIHLLGTRFSVKIHQSAKPIADRYVSSMPEFHSLKSRLKVVHFIFDFHNHKRYGGYYWRVGLMTMFAFIKYLLLYGEFLMYMYKHFSQS